MAVSWQAFSNLTKGELDPRLMGRVDLDAYYQGCQEATNVLSLVQGGMKRRPGTFYVDSAENGRLESFTFNTEQVYLLVFTALKITVYKDGVYQTDIVSPYSLSQVRDFDIIQSADTAIITHPDIQTQALTRSSDVLWTIDPITFTDQQQYDYDDALSPTPVDEIQNINFDNSTNGDRYKLSLEGILTEEIPFSKTDTTANENNIRESLYDLPNTGTSGISVAFVGGGENYEVTFSGDSANNWDNMIGSAVAVSSQNFKITVTNVQEGTARREDVWSNTRGWPRTCTFHEGRLWFGGSLSLPQTIWGSVVNDFYSFKVGKSRDDESISATLDSEQLNAVTGIISNRALQIFTTGKEFYVPASPITPGTIAVKPQTNFGSKRVRPITLDGRTLYAQRTGKILREFAYVDETGGYESTAVSLLASHMINDPVELVAAQGDSASDTNYAYILNDDGILTVFNSIIGENINAFTRWQTEGDIKSIAIVGDTLYMLVKRDGDFFIESEFDGTVFDGGSVYLGVPTDTLTGLDHLNGKTVNIRADFATQEPQVVVGGQITIDRDAIYIEAGLYFKPTIKLMPLNINLQNGPNIAEMKKVNRVGVQLYESLGVIVNGERISDKTFGVNTMDNPEPQTGYKEVYLLGWSQDATVEITQEESQPFTLLSAFVEIGI